MPDYPALIAEAEAATDHLQEGPRRIQAFGIVLSDLVARAGTSASAAPSTKKVKSRSTRTDSGRGRRTGKSKAQLMRDLISDGFFDELRTLPDLVAALEERGHLFKQADLSGSLNSMTKAGELIRTKKAPPSGGRVVWHYKAPPD